VVSAEATCHASASVKPSRQPSEIQQRVHQSVQASVALQLRQLAADVRKTGSCRQFKSCVPPEAESLLNRLETLQTIRAHDMISSVGSSIPEASSLSSLAGELLVQERMPYQSDAGPTITALAYNVANTRQVQNQERSRDAAVCSVRVHEANRRRARLTGSGGTLRPNCGRAPSSSLHSLPPLNNGRFSFFTRASITWCTGWRG
jgi:hypothetical protein